MTEIILLSITCSTIITIIILLLRHSKGSIDYNCSHDMKVEKVLKTKSTAEYLSTCCKCGKQRTHFFGESDY